MSTPVQVPTSTSKPVRLLAGVAGATVVLASGLPPLTPDAFDWVGPAVGLLGLVITAFLASSTEKQVTPWADVSSKVDPETGVQYAGPAAPGRIKVGDEVDVTSAAPSQYGPSDPPPPMTREEMGYPPLSDGGAGS